MTAPLDEPEPAPPQETSTRIRDLEQMLRDLHAAIDRIRNLPTTPPQIDPDDAYTAGWQAHAAAVTTELVDVHTPRRPA